MTTVAAILTLGLVVPTVVEAASTVASDDMNRSMASGLGSAPTGGAYSVSDANAFSVSAGVARGVIAKPGLTVSAVLGTVSTSDVDESATFTLPKLPASGGGVYLSLQARRTGTAYYQTQVRVGPTGQALLQVLRVQGSAQAVVGTTQLATKVAAGVPFVLETTVTGTSPVAVSSRLSPIGQTRQSWDLSATDASASRIQAAGAVGVAGYLSRSTPQAQTFTFDDLLAKKASAPSDPAPVTPPAGGTSPVQPVSSAPTWDLTHARNATGSAAVGTTAYAAPASAVYASPTAAAGGTGTLAAPFATAQAAIDKAPNGATIVLRGGTYHESITVPAGKKLTIQSYPHEAVWFDGTEQQQGWKVSGSRWYVDGWNYTFDSSPTFTKGAPDGTNAGWQWVNAAHPMAAHPEEVFIDGVPMKQVGSLSAVVAGTFFADTAAHRLYIGSNPTGHTVRAATLTKAMSVRGAGTTVRGIGIRGYATSVWMMGAVTLEAANNTLENDVIYDTATTGAFVGAANATLKSVTVARNGLLGIGVNYADGLKVDNALVLQNNTEQFNSAPVAGGIKITKSRGVTISDSAFMRNSGAGLWTDQSVYSVSVSSSDFVGNTGHGVFFEISQKVAFVNNLVLDNQDSAVKIDNTGDVTLWNNTVVGGDRTLEVLQDSRSATDASVPGHDPRQPFPDPTMPWVSRNISVGNNVLASSSGNCTFCVEDYTHTYSASALGVTSNGNVLQRTGKAQPTWLVVWSAGKGNPTVYTSLSAFSQGTGEDRHSLSVDGSAVTAADGSLLSSITASATQTAVAPPAAAVSLLGSSVARAGAIFG